MNLLDLLLAVLLVLATVNGYRLGIVARGASWVGLGVGFLASLWTVPAVLRLVGGGSPSLRLLLGAGTMMVTISLIAGIADVIGLRLRSRVVRSRLSATDSLLGAVGGGLSVLVLVWLLLPAAAAAPGEVARQVRNSNIVSLVEGVAPQPPDTVQALRPLIDRSRIPEVFEDLRPAPDTGPPPSEIPVPPRVVRQVEASTVNVEAVGCGRRFEGSGWTVGPNRVITNAHVIAGADRIEVRRPDGALLAATVTRFDDDRDLAVLAVEELDQEPLPLGEATAGTDAAAVGYPGGQNRVRTEPARVTDVRSVVGRDIYHRDRTERRVLFMAADLRQGDSGGPVVDTAGTVVGVTFAISPDREGTAFALAPSEVRAVLDGPATSGTGRCV